MKKVEIKKINTNTKITLNFHECLNILENQKFIHSLFKKIYLYIPIINLFFSIYFSYLIAKKLDVNIAKSIFYEAIKYWSLIYLIPLFLLGIIVPSALVLDLSIEYFSLWIGFGCFFVVFVSPYTLLWTWKIYLRKINVRFSNQLQKINLKG